MIFENPSKCTLSPSQLTNIIKDHVVVRYANSAGLDTLDAVKVLDEDPADTSNVILVYSGWSVPKTNFNVADGWNREHLWPDSYGFDEKDS